MKFFKRSLLGLGPLEERFNHVKGCGLEPEAHQDRLAVICDFPLAKLVLFERQERMLEDPDAVDRFWD